MPTADMCRTLKEMRNLYLMEWETMGIFTKGATYTEQIRKRILAAVP